MVKKRKSRILDGDGDEGDVKLNMDKAKKENPRLFKCWCHKTCF